MKQYDNRVAVAVLICLKEIIFYILLLVDFCVCKHCNILLK